LISTGFFKNTRNPNYLGEVLIYGSFVICAGHIFSYMIFFCGSCLLFSINMYLKDRFSYQKKEGWATYKEESYILFPKVFPSLILNTALYGVILLVIVYIASMPNIEKVPGANILP
jgi:steroid 5-alpha reductase family enzyme